MRNFVERRRYLFLMRHADHRDRHVTKDGAAHVRALAARLSEWMRADWRDQRNLTIRLWYTTQASEVRETVDLQTREVLAEMRRYGSPRAIRSISSAGPRGSLAEAARA